MSFIGKTEERLIKTTTGKTFKIFITQQEGGFWVATVFYTKDGAVNTKHFAETEVSDAYKNAVEWVLNNIDDKADIEAL